MGYINCNEIVDNLKADIKKVIDKIAHKKVKIAIIRVGDKVDDIAYERSIISKLSKLEIECLKFTFNEEISDSEFKKSFKEVNENKDIDGIIVLAPLPKQLDMEWVAKTINPEKDLDSISYENILKMYDGKGERYAPCTPQAVLKVLDYLNIDCKTQKITLVGTGRVVGKPLATLLMERGATITTCNEFTTDLVKETKSSDIIISATGVPNLISEHHINSNHIIIDVGINVDKDNNIVGDVSKDVHDKIQYITPVPNGVGTITTYVLAKRLVDGVKL
ncbi:methylenetetrahydrofolate dehydrogenase (NADP+)/methenyltetrahydrofolate cyclohydrolase [Bacilli bacterium PM5-3]|nr:methylenetetrahydrofolate dehydrogenase (NADP+)/methenyltetrahydrofolate cyclohydrolase [Bacilli bacterium PM5-3]